MRARVLLSATAWMVTALISSLHAQMPVIGIVDYYGIRRVSPDRVKDALQIRPGEKVPADLHSVEKRLESVPGVVRARLSVVCCDDGKTIIYVGIEERGSDATAFRPAPGGTVRLPQAIIADGRAFDAALQQAVIAGDSAEDDSQGHAFFPNERVRAVQQRYVTIAAQHLQILRDVLRNCADAEQRALAAEVIAYSKDKRAVVPDLEYAMFDSDPNVRNGAMRALAIIAGFARKNPLLTIRVAPEPFVAMLNSPIWTDRNKATLALLNLTEARDQSLLLQLRKQALPSLVEMARWQSGGHALPAFVILGRIAGLPDSRIYDTYENGDRETVIAATKTAKPTVH